MYKHAKSIKPALQDGHSLIRNGVIAFRIGRDNRRNRRVYRRVWPEHTKRASAMSRWQTLPSIYGDAYLIVDGEIVDMIGDGSMVAEWLAARKGVNRGVDPFSAAGYMDREQEKNRNDAWIEGHGRAYIYPTPDGGLSLEWDDKDDVRILPSGDIDD